MNALLKEQRQQTILEIVRNNGQCTVADLSDRFGVSEVTIRRDLQELADNQFLHRTHGGAVAMKPTTPSAPILQRMMQLARCKGRIGQAAANLISDGDSVFIGSGSTTAYVARYLLDRKNLTVVTNALNVADELALAEDATVVVTGGVLRKTELSLIGHIAEQALQEVRVAKVIIGIPAISLNAGLTNDYLPEVMTDRAIIQMAPELIVVADHTKFEATASAYLAPVSEVTTLVTDSGSPPETLTQLEAMGIRIIKVDTPREADSQ
jgi:DeoR/GlpR family transcriptional regulator of sugar metabolism